MPVHLSIRLPPVCTFDLLPTGDESVPFHAIHRRVGGGVHEFLFNSEIAPEGTRLER